MRTRPLVLALAALLLGPAAPAHAETTIAETDGPTSITAYGSVSAWSAYDPNAKGYVLMVREGTATRALAIAPSPTPFDADAGPDAAGRPELVYARCATPERNEGGKTFPPGGCDVYRYDLASNTEQPVPGVNTARGSEYAPTTWRGTVAFARTVGAKTDVRVTGRGVARRLLPTRECFVEFRGKGRTCRKTTDRRVEELELAGSRLAAVTYVNYRGVTGFGLGEVRLATVGRPGARTIASTNFGLSDLHFTGIAIDRGRLSFYRGCGGDPAGCKNGRAGIYRYRFATKAYDQLVGPFDVAGHATGGGLERIVRYVNGTSQEPGGPCRIVELDGARFVPVEPLH
jgi:hypothetical protein